MKRLPNRLFVMQAYEDAYKYNYIVKRYNKGAIHGLQDGWIPNHIWNDYNTVGSDRRAREVHNNLLYSMYFETIDRKEYIKRYTPFSEIHSNYEYTRVKPEMRLLWAMAVCREMGRWEK